MPEDNVTCLMSSGTPANTATSGIKPSMNPKEMLPARPATCFFQKRPNRSAARTEGANQPAVRL